VVPVKGEEEVRWSARKAVSVPDTDFVEENYSLAKPAFPGSLELYTQRNPEGC